MAFLEGIGRISVLLKTRELAQYLVGEGVLLILVRLNVLLEGRI